MDPRRNALVYRLVVEAVGLGYRQWTAWRGSSGSRHARNIALFLSSGTTRVLRREARGEGEGPARVKRRPVVEDHQVLVVEEAEASELHGALSRCVWRSAAVQGL